jgi:type IV pilus assembly protein PilW
MSEPRISRRARARGVSLVELMVAITLGTLLVFGATKLYVDSRKTHDVNEATARLQETARFAMSVLESDIRMSNYWGLVKGASLVTGSAAQDSTSGTGEHRCGTNYARDLMLNLDGSNNAFKRNKTLDFPSSCAPYGAGAVASADTLTVRRASTNDGTAGTGRLQICSNRMAAALVTDSTGCTAAPSGKISDLITHTYYISQDSVGRAGVPSLRRLTLVAGPEIRDDEIIPGIEDLQVQFGIDPSGSSGRASRYVNPGDVPAGAQVVSVRIWLLVRSEDPEPEFVDGRTYSYGDRDAAGTTATLNSASAAGVPYAPADNFRRLLVSRTIQIRNALGT